MASDLRLLTSDLRLGSPMPARGAGVAPEIPARNSMPAAAARGRAPIGNVRPAAPGRPRGRRRAGRAPRSPAGVGAGPPDWRRRRKRRRWLRPTRARWRCRACRAPLRPGRLHEPACPVGNHRAGLARDAKANHMDALGLKAVHACLPAAVVPAIAEDHQETVGGSVSKGLVGGLQQGVVIGASLPERSRARVREETRGGSPGRR